MVDGGWMVLWFDWGGWYYWLDVLLCCGVGGCCESYGLVLCLFLLGWFGCILVIVGFVVIVVILGEVL